MSKAALGSWPLLARLTPLLRIGVFLLGLGLIWLPLALPFYWLAETGRLDLGGAIATGLLYVLFLVLWPRWGRRVHGLPHPWQALGMRPEVGLALDFAIGLAIGLLSIGLLVGVQLLLGWAGVQAPPQVGRLLAEGALVGMAVGIAEELLFRGWLLLELERGHSKVAALALSALLFAAVHFIRPLAAILATLPQLFGLLLLGLALGWARRTPGLGSTPGLGLPSGLHGGLVAGYYLVSVGNMVVPTGAIPTWVTGIDRNPLAGLLGLTLLGLLGLLFYQAAHGRFSPLR